jgi:hypothetical protein
MVTTIRDDANLQETLVATASTGVEAATITPNALAPTQER